MERIEAAAMTEPLDPMDAFTKYMKETGSQYETVQIRALAFFVGYGYGATGARENIDALIEAWKSSQATNGSGSP